jgi:hypothetical protein
MSSQAVPPGTSRSPGKDLEIDSRPVGAGAGYNGLGWLAGSGGSEGRGRRREGPRPGVIRAQRNQLPGGAVAEEARDQRGMHSMSGALGNDMAEDVMAGKGEIADEVEDLVAGELVAEAEGAILHAGAGEDDNTGFRSAADKAHVAELLFVFAEAERAGGGDFRLISAGSQIDHEALAADGRGEVDAVRDGVAVAGVNADEFSAFTDFDGFEDAKIFAAAALRFAANVADGLNEGKRAAVENGKLEVVELDDDVIDAHAEQGREQVLRRGNEDTLAHEAGGVTHLGDVAADGGDFEAVEVSAAKDYAAAGRGGEKPHVHGRAGVEADAGELDGRGDGVFQMSVSRIGQAVPSSKDID